MEGWRYICKIFSPHTQLLIITKENTDDIMRDSEITTHQRRLCGGGSTEPGMEKQVQPSMEKPVWGNRSMSKVMGSGWEDLVSLATLE